MYNVTMTYTEPCPSCKVRSVAMHHKADHAWGECDACGEYFEIPHYEDEG